MEEIVREQPYVWVITFYYSDGTDPEIVFVYDSLDGARAAVGDLIAEDEEEGSKWETMGYDRWERGDKAYLAVDRHRVRRQGPNDER